MAYIDISDMSRDMDIENRIAACAAQELPADSMDPHAWTGQHILRITATPGWSEAWASAVAGGVPTPGRDPGVITDQMILSAVQPLAHQPISI